MRKRISSHRWGAVIAMVLCNLGTPLIGSAEGLTQEQGNAILQELKQIRQLLQKQQILLKRKVSKAPQANQEVKLPMVDTYVLGEENAPVTLMEFTDYQCPYCSKFHKITFPQIKKHYIDTGKVRFVGRDLPLDFHKNARQAARSARCAGEQNRFWEIRHVLSVNPKNLGMEEILKHVKKQQLDVKQFQSCLESEKYEKEINQDISDAHSVGITGTPGFILGPTARNILKGVKIIGAQSYATFATKIDKLLVRLKK